LIQVKVESRKVRNMEPSQEVLMTVQTLYIAAVICAFGIFGVTMAYGQFMTRGIVAPGARPLDKD
jgi:hypothetical protein